MAGGDRDRRLRPVGDADEGHRRELSVDVPGQRRSAPRLRGSCARRASRTTTSASGCGRASRPGRRSRSRRSCAAASRRLSQRIEGWGNAKATTVVGDPLEGVMSTVPGLALASTANPALALLGDALAMLPWNRTASPWESGSVLFRRPDGGIWPYDPAGGRKRPLVVRHLRRTAGLRQIGARQHDQHRPVPQLGGAGRRRREVAADRQGRYRQECRGLRPADPGGARAAAPARGDLHVVAVRPRSRIQHLRPAGRLRISAAARDAPSCRTFWRWRPCRPTRPRRSRAWRS